MAIALIVLKIIAVLIVLSLVYTVGWRNGQQDGVTYTLGLLEFSKEPIPDNELAKYTRDVIDVVRAKHTAKNSVRAEWEAQRDAAHAQGIF